MMQLHTLIIRRCDYGANNGTYSGTAKFDGEAGEVQVKLTAAHCEKIFGIVADGVVECAKEAAEKLTAECMASKPTETLKIA
jgi:hypothetical protein